MHLRELSKTFNTIRLYGWRLDDHHNDFLELCRTVGLRVIITFAMDTSLYADLTDEATASVVLRNFRHTVRAYKGHPAVLMWAISNEPNDEGNPDSYASARRLGDFFHFLRRLAEVRDDEEGFGQYHPHPMLVCVHTSYVVVGREGGLSIAGGRGGDYDPACTRGVADLRGALHEGFACPPLFWQLGCHAI